MIASKNIGVVPGRPSLLVLMSTNTSELYEHRRRTYESLIMLTKFAIGLPPNTPIPIICEIDALDELAERTLKRISSQLNVVDPRPSGRRQRQVLDLLLRGDSEKQIAYALQISQHTVHVYVKQLYVSANVNSRGELLSHWIPRVIFWNVQGERTAAQAPCPAI